MKEFAYKLIQGISSKDIPRDKRDIVNDLIALRIVSDSKIIKLKSKYRIGKVDVTKKGFGFLIPLGVKEKDYLIEEHHLNGAAKGDLVIAEKLFNKKGRPKAKVIYILDKAFSVSVVYLTFEYKNTTTKVKIIRNNCSEFSLSDKSILKDIATLGEFKVLMIETPFVWNIFSTLKSINNIAKSQIDFEIPTVLNDLYLALNTKLKSDNTKIKPNIKTIINGEFKDDAFGNFSFEKKGKNIELANTAMGIKYFGILQVLSKNNHFYKDQILILDEPEVHLHPTWQLELAKLIVYLVSKGVKILINSHSPYMIEALQVAQSFVDIFEQDYIPVYTQVIPPKLSKHGLYFDSINDKEKFIKFNNNLLYMINGTMKISEIAHKLELNFFEVFDYLERFRQLNLIEELK